MTRDASRPGEFALIAKYFAPLAASAPGAVHLSDDVATVKLPTGQELVVTTDTLIAGVHFLADDPPDLIARKALRVNLSDLAAKGAKPFGYLLALSLPRDWREDWIAAFARGLAHDQKIYAVDLLGGDTTATPGPLTLTITALGRAPEDRVVRRSGAQAGDVVFFTGTIGDAGGGLAVLKGDGAALAQSDRESLIARYRLPEPRIAFGERLIGIANASLDVSDGLIADLGHVAEASGVRIVVEAAKLPISPALGRLRGEHAVRAAATGGDDYEIAFTAGPNQRPFIAEAAKATGTAVTEIGRVEAGEGVVLMNAAGEAIPLSRGGYAHF